MAESRLGRGTAQGRYRDRMSSSAPAPSLRPRGAIVICLLVWVILAALAIEALFSAGIAGLLVYPGLALVAVVLWAVLWAPRLVLLPEGVEVRNLLHTYSLPFDRIEAVRLGAMVLFDVDDLGGRPRRVTAWNAPGVRRDNPLRRGPESSRGEHVDGAARRTERRRRLSQAERLRQDQASSRSAVVLERWERWHDTHPAGADAPARRSLNVLVLAVVGAVVLVNLALLLV